MKRNDQVLGVEGERGYVCEENVRNFWVLGNACQKKAVDALKVGADRLRIGRTCPDIWEVADAMFVIL
ncbi:MAG: hypothetical protein EOP09_00425 [Proteobacteria bacterium]|nr:MAG: hypothetical protein EOP09_00425 [Pseudomonadota bacterium]